MTTWKIIRIYVIPAETRREAQELFANAVKSGSEDTYFESEVVKKLEEEQGWRQQCLHLSWAFRFCI